MQGLDFSVVTPYTDLLLKGVWWTVVLTATRRGYQLFSSASSLLSPCSTRRRRIAYPIRFFMWLFMGTPLLLQLFLVYFGLAQIGINVPALTAGIIGLGLHFAVYNADVMRAGIVAQLMPGRRKVRAASGSAGSRRCVTVVVPQAVRDTLPSIGGNLIVLLDGDRRWSRSSALPNWCTRPSWPSAKRSGRSSSTSRWQHCITYSISSLKPVCGRSKNRVEVSR